jgi:hypothetical protein
MKTIKQTAIVAIGDLHCGSIYGIATPKFTIGTQRAEANAVQLALYEKMGECVGEWPRPDVLICNGDAIDGKCKKDGGLLCWSQSLEDQAAVAAGIIKMWKAKKIYVTRGSAYHVDADGVPMEEMLAREVGAERAGTDGGLSADEYYLRHETGPTFHVAHAVSVGTGWYRATPLSRELVFALLTASHKYRANIIIRSHVHYHVAVEFTSQRGYTLPCWQAQTRYMLRKSALGMMPDIGAVRFLVGEDGSITVQKKFFKIEESKPRLIQV